LLVSHTCTSRSELGLRAGKLALALGLRGSDLGEDVGLAQDQVLVDPDLHLGAAVLREADLVADGDVHRDQLARRLAARARTDREHPAALRLLLGRVRQNDAADRRLLLLEDLDDETVT